MSMFQSSSWILWCACKFDSVSVARRENVCVSFFIPPQDGAQSGRFEYSKMLTEQRSVCESWRKGSSHCSNTMSMVIRWLFSSFICKKKRNFYLNGRHSLLQLAMTTTSSYLKFFPPKMFTLPTRFPIPLIFDLFPFIWLDCVGNILFISPHVVVTIELFNPGTGEKEENRKIFEIWIIKR